jgi:hypothetical protein
MMSFAIAVIGTVGRTPTDALLSSAFSTTLVDGKESKVIAAVRRGLSPILMSD